MKGAGYILPHFYFPVEDFCIAVPGNGLRKCQNM